MAKNGASQSASLSAKSKPQYHYFYGSTDGTDAGVGANEQEQESLIGEELVATDQEGDTPPPSSSDLQHLMVTNGDSSKPWFLRGGPGTASTTSGTALLRSLAIILLVATLGAVFLVVLIPHTSQPIPSTSNLHVPFPKVDRADYGDPVDAVISMDLFHPTLLETAGPRSFIFPFPTGAFCTNFVLHSPEGGLSYPVVVYPYAFKWSEDSLQLSYPSAHRFSDQKSIIDTFAPELTIGIQEQVENRFVTSFDPLSVTLRFVASQNSKWETPLVQGSPYTTMIFLNATPVFKPLSIFKGVLCPGDDDEDFSDLNDDDQADSNDGRHLFGVCSIDDSDSDVTTMRGVQFIFKTQEGVNWLLFASEPMNLKFDAIRKTTITSSAPFTGIIRIAYVPAKQASELTEGSSGLRRLIYHAGVYPTGGQVTWEFPSPQSNTKPLSHANTTSRMATVHFNYATHTMADNSLRPNAATNGLLMLALPHHADVLPKKVMLSSKRFDLNYRCIKGPMTPVIGSTWSYEEPLLDIEFDGPTQTLSPEVRKLILDQIEADMSRVLPTTDENVYGFGKQVARLAQLVHIAHVLQEESSEDDQDASILDQTTNLLRGFLEKFLSGDVRDGLLFDSNLGGLVSHNGLSDKSEDFGNGRYNDHHFHYGYILYASAILARHNSSFLENFGSHVDSIFHDVAHPSNTDSRSSVPNSLFFPMSRHKSWFDGHSFATGMFSFGTGKSQESSSEAVNCYYGAYLWSLVRHGQATIGSDLTDFTRLLLAMEIRGAKTYWHMIPTSVLADNETSTIPVYTPEFRENYMVGNVGMMDVASNTWFGNDPLYVHMINAIPITAATAVLFGEEYVKYEYPFLMQSRSEVEMAWRGYTTSIHAIIDYEKAWKDAQDLVSYELDAAISKSQVLYWISQRPGFRSSSTETSQASSGSANKKTDSHIAATPKPAASPGSNEINTQSDGCESHPKCSSIGLTGKCCPTDAGSFLDCCSK